MIIDWTNIYKKYKGSWIALKNDEITVLASGPSATDVFKKAKELGYDNPVITRVPKKLIPLLASLT